MPAPQKILDLVDRFKRNADEYRALTFNEANLRIQFIDPMFKELGWDMANEQGHAEAYKEVVHEASLKIGEENKAPDYCFRIGGTPKFYLEAKKPATKLENNKDAAYQLRRYAWSAKLPLSILTNFDEFAVYDGRIKPAQGDSAAPPRVMFYRFNEYPEKWDEIAKVFARESILNGSFDKFADSNKKKRGTATVDAAFLEEIEGWRDELAKNFALRNAKLTSRELNYAVQITIDRIIFLRMCEDRGIEPYGQLRDLSDVKDIYGGMFALFRKADDRYNSGLFHFEQEKGRPEGHDELTPRLKLDDKVLKQLLGGLYYPKSPYVFSKIPTEILGQVYEQFLGKVIRLTAGHTAKVEEKPEVKKAGGVYYTPTYIVDYIVKHTVGKLLGLPLSASERGPGGEVLGAASADPSPPAPLPEAERGEKDQRTTALTPKQASKLKILDPACGSGSFLLGAYQYLLDWHLTQYKADRDKYQKELFRDALGEWSLTTQEKKRILLNNIYGVDIDAQAVEVTKLSLLLKVLENETQETINQQRQLFHGERVLPDLASNIKCGNSLIGPDFYDEPTQGELYDGKVEVDGINVFDWRMGFPSIMKSGGFDAVVGNPPYVGFHGFAELKEYLRKHYVSAHGKFDIYLPFIEQALKILRPGGQLGFICPTNFMKRNHGAELRQLLRETATILEITDFEDVQIFQGATNYTGIFILEKARAGPNHRFRYRKRELANGFFQVEQAALSAEPWVFRRAEIDRVVQLIRKGPNSLLVELTRGISEGIVTGHNDVFLLPASRARELKLEPDLLRPCVRGRNIRRYAVNDVNEVVIYPYRPVGARTVALSEAELKKFPRIWRYLNERRHDLQGRGYFDNSSKEWYELWCQRDYHLLATPKILVPELAESNRFALVDQDYFYGDTVCAVVLLPEVKEHVSYFLGLLNSTLLEFFYQATTVPKANRFFIYKTMFLGKLPIRRINFGVASEKSMHDRMVALVERVQSMNSQLAGQLTPSERVRIQLHLDSIIGQIDRLTFELYGLSEEQIEVLKLAS